MYSQEFWNNIYLDHYLDAPWMDDTSKSVVFNRVKEVVSPLLKSNNDDFYLLDYGCGNGHMGLLFCEKGAQVDLSDISDVLVGKLRLEYGDKPNVSIYTTKTPDDLPKGKQYDVIIAINVFHHLVPEVWHLFLTKFCERLKPGGLLIISGWDKEDEVIKQENNIARYTEHKTWFINDLPNYMKDLSLETTKDEILEIDVKLFNATRKFRFFVFKNIINKF